MTDSTPTDALTADDDAALAPVTDPSRLAERPGVALERERRRLPAEHFEHWTDRAGLAGVGITGPDGAVLLADGPHGWALPYVEVDPGEDWVATVRSALRTLTGVAVDPVGVARLTRVENVLADDPDRRVRTHEVVFEAPPVRSPRLRRALGSGPGNAAAEDLPAVEWFDHVPAGAAAAHEDAEDEVADVELFLG